VRLDDGSPIVAAALNRENTVLAVAGSSGLRAFELDLKEVELTKLHCPRIHATAVAFAPRAAKPGLWIGAQGSLRYCDVLLEESKTAEQGVVERWSQEMDYTVVDLRVTDQFVVAVGKRVATVISAESRKQICALPKVSGYITAVDFIDSARVAIGTTTHSLHIWDLATKQIRHIIVPPSALAPSARICGSVGLTSSIVLLWTADALVKVNLDKMPDSEDKAEKGLAPFFQKGATAWQVERRFKWIVGMCALPDFPGQEVAEAGSTKALLCEFTPADFSRTLPMPFERKQYGN
jgi:hypothetical protein